MLEELSTELEELLAVDIATLPVMAVGEHVGKLERARAQLDAHVLDTLAEFEQSQAWRLDASYSVTNWLQAHVGTSKADAQRRMRLARHLGDMPATRAALRAGRITTEHARVLAWCVANPRTKAAFVWDEAGLVNEARGCDADALANRVRSWMELVDQDGPEPPEPDPDRVYASRVGDRVKVDGDFGLDTGVPLLEALNERGDQLFRRDREVADANPNDPVAVRHPADRRAEALWELVMAGAGDEANPRSREPLFNVYVDYRTQASLELHPESVHELEDRSVVPMRTLTLWRCEAQVSPVLLDSRKVMLSYGRTERYANRAMRRALAARDRGCAVPGCDRPPQHCDAHHVVFWEDDGLTDIDNLVLLCRHHHRMIHAGSLHVEMVGGRHRFYDGLGMLLTKGRWRPPDVSAA